LIHPVERHGFSRSKLTQALDAALEAQRSTARVMHPPTGRFVLSEFNHASRVEWSDRATTAFARHNLLASATPSRPARQINQRSLWIVERVGIRRYLRHSYAEEGRNPFAIREQPSFNRAHSNSETHVWRRLGKPPSGAGRRAFTVPVEIDEDDPGGILRSSVVAPEGPEQRRFSLSTVDAGKP
jgi:hypothetical protein